MSVSPIQVPLYSLSFDQPFIFLDHNAFVPYMNALFQGKVYMSEDILCHVECHGMCAKAIYICTMITFTICDPSLLRQIISKICLFSFVEYVY